MGEHGEECWGSWVALGFSGKTLTEQEGKYKPFCRRCSLGSVLLDRFEMTLASSWCLASIDVSLVVVVHGGGASNISPGRKELVSEGIAKAATEGYNILKAGGSAVDAVEGAVTMLENDPEFNAGYGSVLNADGDIEMDASIMDGKDLSAGAVSAVRCIANPVKLARLVMEKVRVLEAVLPEKLALPDVWVSRPD